MAKQIVAGNWKMNLVKEEAKSLLMDLKNQSDTIDSNVQVIICPPSIYSSEAADYLKGSSIKVGAQNCSSRDNGAFTGEVSAEMYSKIGVKYVILGHSERRLYDNETDSLINHKIHKALDNGLKPILCVGESLDEREADKYKEVITNQVSRALFEIEDDQMSSIVIAYEPVWAIGTGKTASSEQAQEVHALIRSILTDLYGEEISNNTSILYGGSCKPENAKEIFSQKDVDGGLIGGASLKADSFIAIANSFQ